LSNIIQLPFSKTFGSANTAMPPWTNRFNSDAQDYVFENSIFDDPQYKNYSGIKTFILNVVKVVWYEMFYRKVDPKMIDVVLEWVIKVCLVPFQNVTHTLLLKKDDIDLTAIRSSWEQCFVVFVTSFVTYFFTVDSGDLTADLVFQFTKDIKVTRIWSTLDQSLQKNGIQANEVESILTKTAQVLLTEVQDHPFGNLILRKQSRS
jgi:hypothetical protein